LTICHNAADNGVCTQQKPPAPQLRVRRCGLRRACVTLITSVVGKVVGYCFLPPRHEEAAEQQQPAAAAAEHGVDVAADEELEEPAVVSMKHKYK
jgi:hypothetical protein